MQLSQQVLAEEGHFMRKRGTPHKRGSRSCCFCGGGPRTKEHIWPQWSHSQLPEGPNHTRRHFSGLRQVQPPWNRQGAPKTIQISAVCGNCNSIWMSKLEVESRPIIESLIKARNFLLTAENMTTLSQYFTMKFMVADQSPMTKPTFNDTERTDFYTERKIPSGLNIILYNYRFEPDDIAQYNKEVSNVHSDAGEALQVDGLANFTVRFGNLMAQGLFFRAAEGRIGGKSGYSLAVHPFEHAPVNWPPLFCLSMPEAYAVQHMIETLVMRNTRPSPTQRSPT